MKRSTSTNEKDSSESQKQNPPLLNEVIAKCKTGEEQMTYNDYPLTFALSDFWRWSVSDILSNATRGRLAEFIVATATNIDITMPRNEWAAFDLETKDNIKLEVKSAAYLQAWLQKELSSISFSTKLHRHLSSSLKEDKITPRRHADVYIFCLLIHKDKLTVNPLNMNQWEFYVLATKELNAYKRSQHSITLKSLQTLTSNVSYCDLYKKVKEKHLLNF
jgi:hypothetical protein